VTIELPTNLAADREWLEGLPAQLNRIAARWSLTVRALYQPGGRVRIGA
jgi:hypothetical protein